jgi:hypothetical protein
VHREEITIEKTDGAGKKVQEKVENPAFVTRNKMDQQLLSYLLASISREVLVRLTEHHTLHQA